MDTFESPAFTAFSSEGGDSEEWCILYKECPTIFISPLFNTRRRCYDPIYLRAGSKIEPEIKINVYGNIYDKTEKGKE